MGEVYLLVEYAIVYLVFLITLIARMGLWDESPAELPIMVFLIFFILKSIRAFKRAKAFSNPNVKAAMRRLFIHYSLIALFLALLIIFSIDKLISAFLVVIPLIMSFILYLLYAKWPDSPC